MTVTQIDINDSYVDTEGNCVYKYTVKTIERTQEQYSEKLDEVFYTEDVIDRQQQTLRTPPEEILNHNISISEFQLLLDNHNIQDKGMTDFDEGEVVVEGSKYKIAYNTDTLEDHLIE